MSTITQAYPDRLIEMQSSNSGDKKIKSFKKVAKKYQHMILVKTSKGDVVGSDVNNEGVEIFNQPSSLLAQIIFKSYLESRDIECTISLAQATMHGSFL